MKGTITVTKPNDAKRNKSVALTNNEPFINCILKINGVQINKAEDLDVVMAMYNLLKYSKNYRKIIESLSNYYRMNQAILFLLIMNILNTRQLLQEILIILLMLKLVMMKSKLVKLKLRSLFR